MASDLGIEIGVALMKKAIDRAARETDRQATWEDIFGTEEKNAVLAGRLQLSKGACAVKVTVLIEPGRRRGQAQVDRSRRLHVTAHRPRRSALATIKSEAMRLASNGTRDGFKFAERLFAALPELKNV